MELFPNHPCSTTTIYRIRKSLKFEYKPPRVRQFLTNDQMGKRLLFAHDHKSLKTDWENVVFSDESWFYLNPKTRKIWRRRGENDNVYIKDILKKSKIIDLANQEHGIFNWIFQQDGARPHTSKKTIKYLKKRCMLLDPWPPNSPDLNPIENLWSIMDKRLENRRPDNEENFIQILKEFWDSITWELQSVSLLRHKLSTKFKAQKKSQIKAQNSNSSKINCEN
ncbi:transposable element-related [Anaeramoeba flamelloides]|uniref:Transposable element-related n=1 Tax=Anaeramoeba flamelloides TaxID=1746091 RepID=A0ABQ8XJJ1_9EUKA|nr:transposable element-related [Anaeramoeba flamelloides]